jgi:signal transduction protein with GAF and PtsI domain
LKGKSAACLKEGSQLEILRKIVQIISCGLDLNEVLKETVGLVAHFIKGDSCFIYLFDKEKRELILSASKNLRQKILGKVSLKLGEGITGWVAKERRVVAIDRNAGEDPRFKFFHNVPEDKYQAFLSVPVVYRGELVGVINVRHKQPHQYTKNEIALLSTIAQQVGGAIENARLYEETKRKAMQIETLSKISETVVSEKYLEEILQLIVTMTAEMMGSKICSLMLLDEKRQELTIRATQSLSEEYRRKPNIKLGESVSGQVIMQKKPIAVLDVTEEKKYMYPDLAKREGLCSLLSVPMMAKGKAIGVINCYTSREHIFSEEEIRILQAIADQAAIAIENTRLMEDFMNMKEALETRKLIERARGVLMKEFGIPEDKAYNMIHRKSMDTCRPIRSIAEAIILASGLKK